MDTFEGIKIPKGIEVFEIAEPFAFGALHHFNSAMQMIGENPKGRIIILRKVKYINRFNFELFNIFCESCFMERIKIVLVGVHSQPLRLIKKDGLYDLIGPQNIVNGIEEAIQKMNQGK